MMGLAMPIEVFGAPDADVSACVALQMPLNTTSAAHAPALVVPAAGSLCARDDSGMMVLLMPMQTQNVIKLVGPGVSRFHLQVTTAPGAIQMKPVRLLGDAQIGAVYEKLGMTVDAPHTAVVETPADDAQVELLVYGSDEGPAPIYLDAEGNLTDRDSSVAGGWAIFANLPQGIHEVFMSHAELTCSADPIASWAGSTEGSASLLSYGNTDPLAFEPLSIAHNNAFGCR
jgi:hypothetical protein